jgi:Fur family peroxide stress response transcriptional regulator
MSKTEKRTTHQKRAIRDALYTMDNHPTASMVAEYLSQDGQKVSRATVFRVLSDAADEGSITRVQLMGEDVRYDFRTEPHYHLHCRCCGRIADAVLPYMQDLDSRLEKSGFFTEKHEIEFIGQCRDCAERMKEQEKA